MNTIPTIEVFTFITRNSAAYAELLQKSMETLKSGRHNIKYKCIESINAERLPEGWEHVDSVRQDMKHNCINHANALHRALLHVKYSFVLFIDADMCMLQKNWDSILFNELNKASIWGTAFADDALQYNRFPNVFFFAFKSSVLKMVDLDFSPKLRWGVESPVRYRITDPREATAFNKDTGDIIKCDTGWRLPLIAYKSGIKSNCLPHSLSQLPYRNEKQRVKCKQKPTHMATWSYKGKLFVTHKQSSRNHPLNGEWGKPWKSRINLYLKKEYGIKL